MGVIKVREVLKRVAAQQSRLVNVIAAGALGLSGVAAFIGVVTRYVFQISTWWVWPVQSYAYIFLVFFGAVVASRTRIHVRVEIIEELFKSKPRVPLMVRTVTQFITLAASCIFTYLSYDFMMWVWAGEQHDVVLKWFPLGVVKSLPFVAGIFFSAYIIRDIIESVGKLAKTPPEGLRGDN